jgi:DNA-binding NarL/FixJ family response regulator
VSRILLAEDHEITRRGVRDVLTGRIEPLEFGEASTTEEALALLAASSWDVLVADLNLPGRGGLDLVAEARRMAPRLGIVVLTAFSEEEFALRCFRLGADAFLAKSSGSAEILAAVRKVLSGGKYVTPELAERLASAVGGGHGARHDVLSRRELQVLQLVATGKSLKEIAAELHLSERTVATYRSRLTEKLGVTSSVELARYALRHHLVE